ncbi:hypothetical protein [Acinetobacter towneri]|uniref:Uncharacterized protein n=1 Tax=Acinetobacter towneri TaxID=202956 RepID=A0AAP9KJB7_9GAMM|nr:hypothetical protein [Acinetobacter towneri]QGM27270.1 hypothetical protein GJD93_06080 [Acinetobacter towneri]
MAKIQEQIANARKANISDQEIFSAIAKSPRYAAGFERARAAGLSNADIARDLGLVIKAVNNASNRRNFTPPDTSKAANKKMQQEQLKKQGPTKFWESGLLGLADIGIPVVQAAEYAADGIRGGINKVFGTNLETDRYEKLTKNYKNINDNHNTVRKANKQGVDVTRMGANMLLTAPIAGAGGTLKSGVPLVSKAGAEFLGKNAALGALVGATGVHENNTQRLKSMGAGALGGAIGAGVGQKVGEGVVKVANKIPTRATTQKISATIDDQIEIALKQSNVKIGDLSDDVVAGLRKEVGAALKSGKAVNKEAVARKIVFDRLGIKPTRAQLTGNSVLWQKQAELAKIQGAGDPLRQTLINNENQVIGALDDVIAKTGGKATDQYGAIKGATDSLLDQNAQNKAFIGAAYDNAMNAPGNDVLINGAGLANDVFTKLDDAALASFLPPDISKKIVQISENPQLFTLKKGEELIKILNTHYKSSLQNGQPTATTHALGIVRQALQGRQDEALQGLLVNGGNDAAQAYQFARQAHRANAELTQRMPLLQDALKGVEPDKLFKKHILGGNAAQLGETIEVLKNTNPQAVADIKQQTLLWISNKSVNQNGGFSPAGMKKALDSLGDRRLLTMFDANELSHIKDIAKAGDYLVTQPNHAYVNNSNTSAVLMNFFGGLINKPGVRVLLSPLKDVADSMKVSRSLKGSVAGEAVPAAANPLISNAQLEIIDKLSKAGLIGGANSTQ